MQIATARKYGLLASWRHWKTETEGDPCAAAAGFVCGENPSDQAKEDLASILEAVLVSSPSTVEVESGFSTVSFLPVCASHVVQALYRQDQSLV